MSKLYKLLVIVFFLASKAQAQSVILTDQQKTFDANPVCFYLEDKTAKLSIKDILLAENQTKFIRNTKPVPVFANTNSAIWFRVTVENQSIESKWLLENVRAYTDSISFFAVSDSNTVSITKHIGLLVPFQQRDFKTNYTVFDLTIPTNSKQTYYFRIKSNKSIQFPLTFSTYSQAFEDVAMRRMAQGLYFGFALLIILYNLFLYFSIREKTFLWYVCYACMVLVQNALQQGFTHEYLTGNIPSINEHSILIFVIAPAFYALFCIEMLNLKNYPKLRYSQYFFIGVYILITVISPLQLISLAGLSKFLRLFITTQSLLAIGIAIWLVIQKYQPARFFLLASSLFLLSVFVAAAKELGFIPYNAFTNYAVQYGSAWEMLMLSFALGAKMNQFKQEKREAEARAYQTTVENARLVQEQNQVLEQKVTERTARLVEANEELHQQQEELISINDALEKQKETIDTQKKQLEITILQLQSTSERLDASIRYAQQIQEVILPDSKELLQFFSTYFSIYLPKDIVSGDFYWFVDLGTEKNEYVENTVSLKDLDILEAISQKIIFDIEETKPQISNTKQYLSTQKAIFVLADCTGHGVSGAFMSMIGHTLLHEIINYGKITEPAKILRALDQAIGKVLKQKEGKNTDGMDISVCLLEKNMQTKEVLLTFAGAKTSIFYSQNQQIKRLQGERSFIGGIFKKEKTFVNQKITLQKNDIIYCLSDGYADQNNENRQSIGTAILTNILQDLQTIPFAEHQEILHKFLQQHQGSEVQRDDITVLGLKI
jgi:serine phosphatase RsbU (regulator of sigma subunit)